MKLATLIKIHAVNREKKENSPRSCVRGLFGQFCGIIQNCNSVIRRDAFSSNNLSLTL